MRRPRAGDGHVPLQGYGGHQADGGHDGHVSHEGRHPAEVGAKHPVPAIQPYIIYIIYYSIYSRANYNLI